MSLLDHFELPAQRVPYQSFFTVWGCSITAGLNRILPPDYVAEIHASTQLRLELAVTEPPAGPDIIPGEFPWIPPSVSRTLPLAFPDDFEAHVVHHCGGLHVVAIIAFVTPQNKETSVSRRLFASKCAAYLHRGIGLVLVDIVTKHGGNLHNEMMDLLELGEAYRMSDTSLSAMGYRPTQRGERGEMDIWATELVVGGDLPIVPLSLKGGLIVPIDLANTYAESRERSRMA